MKYKLNEIGTIIGGGTPSTKNGNYYASEDSEISWITPKDLSGFGSMYISHGSRDITDEGYENSSAKKLPKDTVLVSSRAPIGYVAIAEKEVSTSQGFKSIIPDTTKILPEYLYWVMKSSKDSLENVASGSTFKEVSASVMADFKIEVPNLSIQHSVVKILTSIQSKIELNQQINDNLVA